MSRMPRRDPAVQPDPIPAAEIVLGVDTHKDFHVAAALTIDGMLVGSNKFRATAVGYRQLLAWASGLGQLRQAGVEGTGGNGAGLARYLTSQGIEALEVDQPDKATRRRRGKADLIDAIATAEAVLSGRASAIAKTGDGSVEIRMFKLAKNSAI
jgi:transposase